jgi:hypothetical protein
MPQTRTIARSAACKIRDTTHRNNGVIIHNRQTLAASLIGSDFVRTRLSRHARALG